MNIQSVKFRTTMLLFAVPFFQTTKVFAKQLYVNPVNGNDAYTYTTVDATHPLKTIQKALDLVTAGDIIYVHSGTYAENLVWKKSGTTSAKIILQKDGTAPVIISATAPAADMTISNQSNIIVDGISFTKAAAANNSVGLLIESSGSGLTSNIEIKNCNFYAVNWSTNPNTKPTANQNSQPLIAYGRSSVAITGINIHNCQFYNNITGQSEVCSINSNIDGFTVANNILHDNTNIAIDAIGHEGENTNINLDQARNGVITGNTVYNNQCPYAEAGGIYVDGGKSIIIEKNIIYNGDYGIEISAENDVASLAYDVQDITVRNNIIYNCRSVGLKIGAYKGLLQNCFVVNNTSFYNNRGGYRDGDVNHTSRKFSPWAEVVLSNMQDVTFENNILYARSGSNNTAMLASDGNVKLVNIKMNNNCWLNKGSATGTGLSFQYKESNVNHNYTSWASYQSSSTKGWDKQSKYANPLFVNEAISGTNIINPDLKIQTGSPAIAAGDNTLIIGNLAGQAGTTDYFGGNRKVGVIDIGAHELSTGSFAKDLPSQLQLKTYPNPVINTVTIEGLPSGEYAVTISNINKNILAVKKETISKIVQLNFSNYKTGLYTITFTNSKGISNTVQVLKQ